MADKIDCRAASGISCVSAAADAEAAAGRARRSRPKPKVAVAEHDAHGSSRRARRGAWSAAVLGYLCAPRWRGRQGRRSMRGRADGVEGRERSRRRARRRTLDALEKDKASSSRSWLEVRRRSAGEMPRRRRRANAAAQKKLLGRRSTRRRASVSTEGDEIHLKLVDKVLFAIGDDQLTDKGKPVLDKVAQGAQGAARQADLGAGPHRRHADRRCRRAPKQAAEEGRKARPPAPPPAVAVRDELGAVGGARAAGRALPAGHGEDRSDAARGARVRPVPPGLAVATRPRTAGSRSCCIRSRTVSERRRRRHALCSGCCSTKLTRSRVGRLLERVERRCTSAVVAREHEHRDRSPPRRAARATTSPTPSLVQLEQDRARSQRAGEPRQLGERARHRDDGVAALAEQQIELLQPGAIVLDDQHDAAITRAPASARQAARERRRVDVRSASRER